MTNTVKVAKLPGTVSEVVLEQGTTIAQALELAGIESTQGFEVKVDGRTVTDTSETVGSASMILLAKKVKGNAALVKVAKLPGTVTEVALEDGASVQDALESAGIESTQGFEIKVDGRTITNLDEQVGSASMILLAKQVKGNVKG